MKVTFSLLLNPIAGMVDDNIADSFLHTEIIDSEVKKNSVLMSLYLLENYNHF